MKRKFFIVVAAAVTLLKHAGADQKPNFLIFLADDLRMDAVSCYNTDPPIETPGIDSLAEQGIRFTEGFVTTPICAVSRATLITGRYARNARVHDFNQAIPTDIWKKSYPALLRGAGYFVGQLGKYGVGLGKDAPNTFHFHDVSVDQGPAFREYKGETLHDSEWLTRRTADFLDAVPEGTPFVLQVNYKAPHGSAVPAPEDLNTLDDLNFDRRKNETDESHSRLPSHVQNGFGAHCYRREVNLHGDNAPYLRRYHEKIMSLDRSIRAIMDDLKKRGLHENTVVFFVSDHGVHIGEKLLGGKWTPYEESLRIPYIVSDPTAPASRRGITDSRMVLITDIAPTMLDMAGVPVPADMDGKSLVPIITGSDAMWRDHFFFEHLTSPSRTARPIPRSVGVRGTETKLFRWIDTNPEIEVMHAMTTDPLEEVNLVQNPVHAAERKRLAALLDEWLANNPDNYSYASYGRRSQSGAPEIDWVKFQSVLPDEYQRIQKAAQDLNVTLDQAVSDPAIREKVSAAARYWY